MSLVKKAIEYGIYLIAFLLPFQIGWILYEGEIAGVKWQYGTIVLYAVDIIIVAVLFLFTFYYFKTRRTSTSDQPNPAVWWWLLSGVDLFAFISIFVARDHGVAVYKYAIFLLAVGLILLINKAPFQKVKFVYFFVLGVCFHAALGIGQFLYQYAPSCKYLGMAEHNPKKLGVSVVETLSADGVPRRWLRAYGGLDHPNILGGIIVIALLLLLGVWVVKKFYYEEDIGKDKGVTRDRVKKQERKQAGNYALFMVLLMGMFFTFSRGAWLAFTVGAAVMFIGYLFVKRKEQAKRTAKILGLGVILVAVLSFSYSEIVSTRLGGGTRLEKKSNHQRMESIEESRDIIRKNLFWGVGMGNYTLALQEKNPGHKAWAYQPVHNSLLLMAAEIGVAGLVFFVALWGYLFIQSFRKKNILNLAVLTSLVIMLMLDHWWWSLHFGVLLLGLVLGLLFKELDSNAKSDTVNSKFETRNSKQILNSK